MPLEMSFMSAWKPLMREDGFSAKWGLTFPERSTPGFKIDYKGHECKWNGPVFDGFVALPCRFEDATR